MDTYAVLKSVSKVKSVNVKEVLLYCRRSLLKYCTSRIEKKLNAFFILIFYYFLCLGRPLDSSIESEEERTDYWRNNKDEDLAAAAIIGGRGPPLTKEFWTTKADEKDVDTQAEQQSSAVFDIWHRSADSASVEKQQAIGDGHWPSGRDNNVEEDAVDLAVGGNLWNRGPADTITAAAVALQDDWGHRHREEAEFAFGASGGGGLRGLSGGVEEDELSYKWRPSMETAKIATGPPAVAPYWEEEDEVERARMMALKQEALNYAAALGPREDDDEEGLEKAAVVDARKEVKAAGGAFNYWEKEEEEEQNYWRKEEQERENYRLKENVTAAAAVAALGGGRPLSSGAVHNGNNASDDSEDSEDNDDEGLYYQLHQHGDDDTERAALKMNNPLFVDEDPHGAEIHGRMELKIAGLDAQMPRTNAAAAFGDDGAVSPVFEYRPLAAGANDGAAVSSEEDEEGGTESQYVVKHRLSFSIGAPETGLVVGARTEEDETEADNLREENK